MSRQSSCWRSGAPLWRLTAAIALTGVSPLSAQESGSHRAQTDGSSGTDGKFTTSVDRPDREIVVTGTLLRDSPVIGAHVLTMNRRDIEATGATTTAQVLQTIPQLSAFNDLLVPVVAGNRVTTNRINLANLPDLAGSAPTLILLDGMRMVGMGIDATSPDPDVIPPGMLERIEILPYGGASLYGSDAIGGVMNFITRKRLRGMEVTKRYGIADSYHKFDTSLTAGIDRDALGALISYNYSENGALFGRDRDYVRQFPAQVSGIEFPITSIRCPQGNVQLLPIGTIHALPFGPESAQPGTANQCDEAADAAFRPRENRHSVMTAASVTLFPDATIDLRGHYTKRKTYQALGPLRSTQFIGPATLGVLPSPFQEEHRLTTGPAEIHQVSFAWGGRDASSIRRSLEVWGLAPSLTVSLGADWRLRASASLGKSETISHSRVLNAIPFTAAIAAGLFNPYEPFASDATVLEASTGFETYGRARQQLFTSQAIVDGELLQWPAGPVRIAVGAQYLDERIRSQTGFAASGAHDTGYPGLVLPANLPGNPSTLVIPPLAPLPVHGAGRHVGALFAEFELPVIGDHQRLPGISEMSISASIRHDRYSDFGSTLNPRLGIALRPLRWIALRASWNRSFLAPSLVDQPAANQTVFTWLSGGALAALSPPPELIADGTWPAPAPGQTHIAVISGSAAGIEPQTAQIRTLGVDIQPPTVPGLTLSFTHWRIRFDKLIDIPPVGNSRVFWSAFGSLATVNPSQDEIDAVAGMADQTFNVCPATPNCLYAILDGRKRNTGSFRASGLDLELAYMRETGFGSLHLGADATYDLNRAQRLVKGSPYVDLLAANASRFRMRASLGGRTGRFQGQVSLLHRRGYGLDPAVGIVPQQTRVASFNVVNLFLSFDLAETAVQGPFSVNLAVDNLLAQPPPEYRSAGTGRVAERTGAGTANGHTLGRTVQFGLSKRF